MGLKILRLSKEFLKRYRLLDVEGNRRWATPSMRHTAYNRIIGAILCGVMLIASWSEGFCNPVVPGKVVNHLQWTKDADLGDVKNHLSFSFGQAGYTGQEVANYLNQVADQANYYQDLGQAFNSLPQLPKDDIVKLVNQINGTNKKIEDMTEQDVRDAAKQAEDAKKEEEDSGTGHSAPQKDNDNTPTPTPGPNGGSCPDGGCKPGGGGGCPGGGCSPGGGGAGAGAAGGGGGPLGGIGQMAAQILPQLLQGLMQGLLQGGGQQNGYETQQLPPDLYSDDYLYPDDADIMRQVEATQTAVYAEATAIAEQALQATATAEALSPEEQEEETSESQPEAQTTATPIISPTMDSMISEL